MWQPTRFRNILNNLRIEYGTRSTFAELQTHHAAILKHNDDSHAHDDCEPLAIRIAQHSQRR